VGYVALFLSIIYFNLFLKKQEVRNMMIVACAINMIGSIFTLLFVHEIYFGMSPMAYTLVTGTITDILYMAYT